MIKLTSDLPIDFQPINPLLDLLLLNSSEAKLFAVVTGYLESEGISAGYSLGKIGEHEETSLLRSDGYWVVAFTERGDTRFLGVFRSYMEATDFFVSHMLRNKRARINWSLVFKE